jgi:predicted nucleic acid-binding protein
MFVVDATVAIKWFTTEPGSDKALDVLSSANRLAAPDFALAEIANGLRRKQRLKVLPPDAVNRAIEGLPRVFHTLAPCALYVAAATEISQDLDHSVYDCVYLVIARGLAAPLVTADTKFVAKLAGTPYAAHVVALGAWKG